MENYLKAKGYLSQGEREYLHAIAKESDIIINVGIEYGASVKCFAAGSKPKTKIIALDLIGAEKFDGTLNCQAVYLDEYNIVQHAEKEIDLIEDVLDAFKQKTVVFIKGDSNTTPVVHKAGVIFIDGCHWGECVKNDIEKYSALCTKYLLFHDYSDSPVHAGVKETLDNWNSEEFVKVNQIDSIAVYKRIKNI